MPPRPQDYRVGRWIAIVGIVASAMLATSSIVVGMLTRSTSVVAAGLEFAGDVVASTVVLFGMVIAGRPPDANHPYGHGKVEYLSIGFEGALIFIAGAFILYGAALGLWHPHPVARPDWGVLLLASTAVVNAGLGLGLVRAGRRMQSVALVGDGQHLYLDALTSIVSSAALVLVLELVEETTRL